MPQPQLVTRLVDQLLARYDALQTDINRLAADVATAPSSARARQLGELRRQSDRLLTRLERETAGWIEEAFPNVYQLGGDQADVAWSFGQAHQAAVQTLASDTWDDVLTATTHVRADIKKWIRETGRRATAEALIDGKTAQQAARDFTKAAAGQSADQLGGPVGMIRYADGSLHTLADYADTLLRTKTATAYNTGTLNVITGAGVGFVEVLDGTDCGWTSHDDGDKANGTVRPARDAYEHMLSHPRCRRSFVGRPDVTSKDEAGRAESLVTPEQQADQTATERAREAQLSERRARKARAARTPRKARSARSPRNP